MSVIQAEPTVEPLLKSLLGRTFIASDLGTATAQIQNGHAGCDFVTLGGELLNRHGIYTGGYLNGKGNGKAPSSILGRKNQIAELQAELAHLQLLVEEASRKRGGLISEQTELQAEPAGGADRNCASRKWPLPPAKANSRRCKIPPACCTRRLRP